MEIIKKIILRLTILRSNFYNILIRKFRIKMLYAAFEAGHTGGKLEVNALVIFTFTETSFFEISNFCKSDQGVA